MDLEALQTLDEAVRDGKVLREDEVSILRQIAADGISPDWALALGILLTETKPSTVEFAERVFESRSLEGDSYRAVSALFLSERIDKAIALFKGDSAVRWIVRILSSDSDPLAQINVAAVVSGLAPEYAWARRLKDQLSENHSVDTVRHNLRCVE